MTEHDEASIGIEIELPWKVMLARVDEEAADILARKKSFWVADTAEREVLQAAFDKLDERYKAKVDAAYVAGIGKGNDGYAEFAHRPERSIEPLLDQVEYLYRADLLRHGEIYPLHVTLGGFALSKAAGQLLFGLEVVGATRPERILQTRSWNRKGKAGMLNRQPHELAVGYRSGVEFRTLELYSQGQLEQVLRTALAGGNAIMGNYDWSQWQEVLETQASLKSIDITQSWPKFDDDEMHWLQYAEALNDGNWVVDSAFKIQKLVELDKS